MLIQMEKLLLELMQQLKEGRLTVNVNVEITLPPTAVIEVNPGTDVSAAGKTIVVRG